MASKIFIVIVIPYLLLILLLVQPVFCIISNVYSWTLLYQSKYSIYMCKCLHFVFQISLALGLLHFLDELVCFLYWFLIKCIFHTSFWLKAIAFHMFHSLSYNLQILNKIGNNSFHVKSFACPNVTYRDILYFNFYM